MVLLPCSGICYVSGFRVSGQVFDGYSYIWETDEKYFGEKFFYILPILRHGYLVCVGTCTLFSPCVYKKEKKKKKKKNIYIYMSIYIYIYIYVCCVVILRVSLLCFFCLFFFFVLKWGHFFQ